MITQYVCLKFENCDADIIRHLPFPIHVTGFGETGGAQYIWGQTPVDWSELLGGILNLTAVGTVTGWYAIGPDFTMFPSNAKIVMPGAVVHQCQIKDGEWEFQDTFPRESEEGKALLKMIDVIRHIDENPTGVLPQYSFQCIPHVTSGDVVLSNLRKDLAKANSANRAVDEFLKGKEPTINAKRFKPEFLDNLKEYEAEVMELTQKIEDLAGIPEQASIIEINDGMDMIEFLKVSSAGENVAMGAGPELINLCSRFLPATELTDVMHYAVMRFLGFAIPEDLSRLPSVVQLTEQCNKIVKSEDFLRLMEICVLCEQASKEPGQGDGSNIISLTE